MHRHLFFLVPLVAALATTLPVAGADPITARVVMLEDADGDPAATGRAAGERLKTTMGDVPLEAVIVSECFEDREAKAKLLAGITSVLPKSIVFGAATYGSFVHEGCTDYDAVCLLGIGGGQIEISTSLVTDMGTAKLTIDQDRDLISERLHQAGQKLAAGLRRSEKDRLAVVLADAHSPKNQFLVEGMQTVLGKDFAITGGCANKNAGQTFVYYAGDLYEDSAVALMLAGNFAVAMSGRQANENDAVIRTAREGAAEAMRRSEGKPLAVLAFNCAGRRSKLTDYGEELSAMQEILGKELPLFGCYCAGEMGPVDAPGASAGARCGGSGWHVMFTVLSTMESKP